MSSSDITPNVASAASNLQGQLSSVVDIDEGRIQTINNISELQDIEKEYFSKLNSGLAQNTLTPEEKDQIVQKINEISQMRINLYKNLNGMYSFYQTNVESTRDTINDQSTAIDIVENELNEAKLRMKEIENEKYNKLRLVEINSYYGEQYNQHSSVMKIVIMIFVPILILTILVNKDIIHRTVYSILLVITVVIGAYYLWEAVLSTVSRDNMNYQEYNWQFNKADAPPVDTTGNNSGEPWPDSSNETCQGQACCDTGFTYDPSPSVNKCMPSSSLTQTATPTSTTENM